METFIAGLRHDGLVAPFFISCPMNRKMFEAYIETQLASILEPGDVVILDNLSAHKNSRAERIFRDRSAFMLFLPPYSPDLNPIEMAFSKVKAHFRKMEARTIRDLWDAIGRICDLYEPEEYRNFFKAAGHEAV